MTKRYLDSGLLTAVILAWIGTACLAGNPRLTPLVRAVQRTRPSVINIHTEKTAYDTGDALFQQSDAGRKVNGMGTGIVIDERGYIVTNHHVVQDVDTLRCTLDDHSTYNAKVVSYDHKHDLAIIKIDASRSLPVMPLGTSSDLMLGETVIAVGNAFGYEHTVTSGIISSLSRDVEVNEKQSYENLIQTDASINPGNSGGPLLNLNGEVVGINVAIRAGAQRIGFAIPIDDARGIIARLLASEVHNSTYHGIVAKDVKSAERREMVISSVKDESPAAIAGLRDGDVVVKAGDTTIIDQADFERALLGRAAGDEVPLVVKREGATENLSLTLGRLGSAPASADSDIVVLTNEDDSVGSRTWAMLGLRLTRLSGSGKSINGTRYRGGMRVTHVRPGSPADSNGIRKGDILVGLHIWETITYDNLSYVLNHPQFNSFNPLKFYVLRGQETLYGHLRVASAGR